MAKTDGKLGLSVFEGRGWGPSMNRNFRKIDAYVTQYYQSAQTRAADVEAVVASYSAAILAELQNATGDYAQKAELLKTQIVEEVKSYIDGVLQPHIQAANANRTTVLAVIDDLRDQIQTLENLITQRFSEVESTLNTNFTNVESDVASKYSSIQAMRDQMLDLLNGLATRLDAHLTDQENPHRVTFEQAGGASAVKYQANEDKDGRYL